MLKITITKTPTEQRWVLEGRLAQPWVDALRAQWRQTRRGRQGCPCVVDLNDVTSMDHSGEQILRAMLREGGHCIARGVYTTHRPVALRRAVRWGRQAGDGAHEGSGRSLEGLWTGERDAARIGRTLIPLTRRDGLLTTPG
jgi:hypothetical protein